MTQTWLAIIRAFGVYRDSKSHFNVVQDERKRVGGAKQDFFTGGVNIYIPLNKRLHQDGVSRDNR